LKSILFRVSGSQTDALIADLWECGTSGIVEDDDGLRAFFSDPAALDELIERYGAAVIETRTEEQFNSDNFARENWDPLLVGKSFFIAPSWVDEPTPAGRVRLTVDATSAFGTGRHESTQLMLEALEGYLQPGATVLDVGCGSGILSMAARCLGATQVISCDLDPEAIATAARHLPTPLFRGTAGAVQSGSFDVVLANISAAVIDAITADLSRVADQRGLLILAGFTQDKRPGHFSPEAVLAKGDWLCWICRPGSPNSPDANRPITTSAEHWWD
jgi:ribosomal protein L11 methyltransferase